MSVRPALSNTEKKKLNVYEEGGYIQKALTLRCLPQSLLAPHFLRQHFLLNRDAWFCLE